jgi:NAD(P)-dependent dehydrogenase (short-subunit alcohol dehydrogenase family)
VPPTSLFSEFPFVDSANPTSDDRAMSLAGTTALVTGAARRLGKAIALELASEGASIVVHYGGSKEEARETAAEIEALGVSAWPVQADLRSAAGISLLFEQVEQFSSRLSVLVNSAASFESKPFLEIDASGWDEVQELNLRAPFLCTQRAAPLIRASGGGAVVNIADLSAFRPWKGFAHHGTSKAALVHLTRAAAYELAPEIRVNCVVPGAILPPPGVSESDESWQRRGGVAPLRRTGTEREVAEAVVFLTCNEFITGAVLPVDGGEHLTASRAVS